jgi:hypothetical protein
VFAEPLSAFVEDRCKRFAVDQPLASARSARVACLSAFEEALSAFVEALSAFVEALSAFVEVLSAFVEGLVRSTTCPICACRRMANTAAAIVDRVLPDVPVRQFVLSLPYGRPPDHTRAVPETHASSGAVVLAHPSPADGNVATAMLAPLVATLAPNVVSVRHWDRLLGGVLYAATARIDWARLLRRSMDVDVLQCPKCDGTLRVLAIITEREPVQRILSRLGMPTSAPPIARARDPSDDGDEVDDRQLDLMLV